MENFDLKKFQLFSNLPDNEIEIFFRVMIKKSFALGEHVFLENDHSDGLYLILSGKVEVIKKIEGGYEVSLATMEEGNFFGEMALLDEKNRSGSIRVVEDCTLYYLSKEGFFTIVRMFPGLAINLLSVLVGRMRNIHAKLVEQVEEKFTTIINTERERQQFINLASHELRTPLTSLLVAIQLLQRGEHEKQRDSLQNLIYSKSILLSRMLNDIFLLSLKGTTGTIEIEDFSPQEILGQILAEFKILSMGRKVNIESTLPEGVQHRGNPSKIGQAFFHLLHNAVRFSRDGTTITVNCWKDSTGLNIEVTDQGVGIQPEHHQLIFKPFYTVKGWQHHHSGAQLTSPDSLAFNSGGAGIGLSIVQTAVQLHKGRVLLDSVPEKGSCFRLIFA